MLYLLLIQSNLSWETAYMASDQDHIPMDTLALIGICLLQVQLAEQVLAWALESVLQDKTLTAEKLMEQTESERKRTLGDFLKELKTRAKIEHDFKDKLYRFLKLRNIFVHNVDEVQGWNLDTGEGRKIATAFVKELLRLAHLVTCVFLLLPAVRAKMDFGKEVDDPAHKLLERHFGSIARKILAGRYRKPVLSPR
jgi:hypothetical protein